MIDIFTNRKVELIHNVGKLLDTFTTLEEQVGLDVCELTTKIKKAQENLQNANFAIAFFGASTDGKSTIISAITKNLNIPIAPTPSTDKVTPYPYKDYLIIDTPGLFSDQVLHAKETYDYISEANLIIYAVDAVNPLKESHYDVVRWLMSDLNKASSIVFVVNKMDNAGGGLENDEHFTHISRIKQEAVIETLLRIVPELTKPRIVCIAAAPYDKELDFWFKKENEEDYWRLSRLGNLINIIDEFVRDARDSLVLRAGLSIIRDGILQVQQKIKDSIEVLRSEKELLIAQLNETEGILKTLNRDRDRAYNNIKQGVWQYRERLIVKLDEIDNLEEALNFYNLEFGRNGYILIQKIEYIIRQYGEGLTNQQDKALKKLNNTFDYYKGLNEENLRIFADILGDVGVIVSKQTPRAMGDILLNIRDMAKLPIKYRPWGAIKQGKKFIEFGKFLQSLPIAVDGITVLVNVYNQKKLDEIRSKCKEKLEDIFSEFFEDFTEEKFQKKYFKTALSIKKEYESLETILQTTEQNISILEETDNQLKTQLKSIKRLENDLG